MRGRRRLSSHVACLFFAVVHMAVVLCVDACESQAARHKHTSVLLEVRNRDALPVVVLLLVCDERPNKHTNVTTPACGAIDDGVQYCLA